MLKMMIFDKWKYAWKVWF